MKTAKRLLAVLLSVIMVAGVLAVAPLAVGAAKTDSDSVGIEFVTMRVGDYHTFKAEAPWNGAISSCSWTVNSPYYLEQTSTYNTYPSITYKALKATSSDIYVNCDFSYFVEGSRLLNRGAVSFRVSITGGSSGGYGDDSVSDEMVWLYFNACGGSVYPTQKKVWKSYSIGDLPTPTRSGYTFEGWEYFDGRRAHSYDYITKNTTLYADWSEDSDVDYSPSTEIKPGKPTISSLSYSGSSNTLKWSSASNATGYQIARKKTGQSDYSYFSTSSTSYTETNVTPGVKYTYQVRAKNGSTYGSYSSGKTVATLTKPTLTALNKSNGIRAECNAVSGATKYIVYYKSESDSSWTSKTTSNTYYPLLNIVPGKKYAFQVQPVGQASDIKGPYSNVVNRVYAPQIKPVLTLSNKSNGVRAEWSTVSGATKYVVYYKKADAQSWSSTETKNTYYPMLNPVTGTKYSFQVLPMFGNAKGVYSAVQSSVWGSLGKAEVTLANKSNGIRAEWKAVSGASQYTVYYKKASSGSWSSTTTKNTYYPLLNITPGTQYSVQVQPINGSVKGGYSAVKSLVYIPQVKPEVTLANTNGVTASWNSVGGATNYIVYYKKTSDSSWSNVETSSTFYSMSNAAANTQYSFQVQPVFNGSKGLYSKVQSITTPTVSTAKPVLTLENGENGIDASWTPVSGATSYIVYFKVSSNSSWKSYETKAAKLKITNVSNGVSYSFQVQPVFNGAKGSYSKVATITYITTKAPELSASYVNGKIYVSWTAIDGATGYRLYWTDLTDTQNIRGVNVTDTFANMTNPTPGNTYFFMVSPIFGDTEGELSNVTDVTIPY